MSRVSLTLLILGFGSGLLPSPVAGEGTGVGIITAEGPPGLFINPTPGTLPEGTFTSQLCLASFDPGGGTSSWWQALAAYGVQDWLEIGGIVRDVVHDREDVVGGPFAVGRLIEEGGAARPNVSIGAYFREGADAMQQRSFFIAASKLLDEVFRPVVGLRHVRRPDDEEDSVFYLGTEIALPRHLYLVGEIQSKYEASDEPPWSAGLQLRHPNGNAFSLGYTQFNGSLEDPAVYVGIGINLD
ncbi:MAG: hypothetical protein GF346_12250 [Candidatus Eisenbacteria bacterium]|nr:hypothetical protein [Candidatus Latescibacterota bacterium]MBD3303207.1 hypothetical protein [Candidatus Eisenbacteria bacterium]